MKKITHSMLVLLILILLAACQSARELHYFRAGGNYYRLKIDERSFASKARYLSGYFDEKAVDKYFSEMSQPDSGSFTEWVSSAPRGSQLVMILSTNSTSIAEQIGNLANNEELLETVALLANKDKIAANKVSVSQLKDIKNDVDNTVITGDAYFESANAANMRNNVKDFLLYLQLATKGKFSFANIDSAIAKYK